MTAPVRHSHRHRVLMNSKGIELKCGIGSERAIERCCLLRARIEQPPVATALLHNVAHTKPD